MKKCPVCLEQYDESDASERAYPDVCAACNDAFASPRLVKQAELAEPPPLRETREERHKRLMIKARQLLVLEFCHKVLSQRSRTDAEHAWTWRLKDKVAVQTAVYLRDMLPPEFRHPYPPLSQQETDLALADHPLLQYTRPLVPDRSLPTERAKELRERVRSLHSHGKKKEAEPDCQPDN